MLNAGRKISSCVQDNFPRFFKFASVKKTFRKFHSCRKLKEGLLLLEKYWFKYRGNSHPLQNLRLPEIMDGLHDGGILASII